MHTVEAKPMSRFGQPGSLRLSFFNDRLMGVRFFAADPKALLATLQEQGLPLVLGVEVERGCVRIAAGVDFAGRSYVAWQDVRMVRQQLRWIRRHS